MSFNANVLKIDAEKETERIVLWLRRMVKTVLHRRGVVLGISGGIDSSVSLALAVRAFGHRNVLALMMPERESEAESEALARLVAKHYGVEPILEDITPMLESFGAYRRRDAAIRRLFPAYNPAEGYKAKITLPQNMLNRDSFNIFSLVVISPDGEEKSKVLSLPEYLQIVGASNIKQRVRMTVLYYQAELYHFAVLGTANRNEREQGFFVKYGDGGVDLNPLAHLYKTQVYQLAEYLDVPQDIRQRPPTTDTYSASQSQEEFFFRLPFKLMDLLWYAQEHQIALSEVAQGMNLSEKQIERAYDEFSRKHRTTVYLRLAPLGLNDENAEAVLQERAARVWEEILEQIGH
jgi:NAD+ synthase